MSSILCKKVSGEKIDIVLTVQALLHFDPQEVLNMGAH
jgi:hypothetical protein